MSVEKNIFGSINGKPVYTFTVSAPGGISFEVTEYGATLLSIFTPDRDGEFKDILVGLDTLDGLVNRSNYQGMTVGPYCNRIGNASFTIDGAEYQLTPNDHGKNSLHSAGELSHSVWHGEAVDDLSVRMSISREDGINGYPGNIEASVVFTLVDNDKIKLEYSAVSDKKTFLNFTNHSYFNLKGYDGGNIYSTELSINADSFTPVDELSIPSGDNRPVEDTPFDFRIPKSIGMDIDVADHQLELTGGFDHNFCISDYTGELREAARAYEPSTGRTLACYTTLPGMQFYAGNYLSGIPGKAGVPMLKRTGFCLETQFYPDTPNRPDFPSCLFDAGEEYRSVTLYAFGIKTEEE